MNEPGKPTDVEIGGAFAFARLNLNSRKAEGLTAFRSCPVSALRLAHSCFILLYDT